MVHISLTHTVLNKNSSLYQITTIVALAQLVDVVYTAINALLSVNLNQIGPLNSFMHSITPLAWGVLLIACICTAMLMIFRADDSKIKGEFARGLLLSVTLIVALPVLFTALSDLSSAGVTDMQGILSDGGTPGRTILAGGIIDVYTSQSGQITTLMGTNQSGDSVDVYYLDINKVISRDDPVFNQKIASIMTDGTAYTERLK